MQILLPLCFTFKFPKCKSFVINCLTFGVKVTSLVLVMLQVSVKLKLTASYWKRARVHARTCTHTHTHTHTQRCYCSTDIDPYPHMTYLWPTWHIHLSYQLMWWGRTVSYICQRGYKRGLNGEKDEVGRLQLQQSQQYPYSHTQFRVPQSAHNRQVQHTKIHQFTADRTANTKCGNQYRLQFQAFYVLFCSRHSSGDADQLVLSTVLGTLDSRPALFGITE